MQVDKTSMSNDVWLRSFPKVSPGFVLIRGSKTADMERTVMKEDACIHGYLETEGTAHGQGGAYEADTERGLTVAQSLVWGFCGKGWVRRGRYAE